MQGEKKERKGKRKKRGRCINNKEASPVVFVVDQYQMRLDLISGQDAGRHETRWETRKVCF